MKTRRDRKWVRKTQRGGADKKYDFVYTFVPENGNDEDVNKVNITIHLKEKPNTVGFSYTNVDTRNLILEKINFIKL